MTRLSRAGYVYTMAGENLAFTTENESTAMQALIQSPPHRENMLEDRFRKVGIGVAAAGGYGQIYVQVFADE